MSDAVIELDRGEPHPGPPGPPPVHRYRRTGLLAAAVLALAAGGAAPVHPVLWRDLGPIPMAAGAQVSFQLTGGRLYTVEATGGGRTATAWSLDPVRRLWDTTVAVPDPSHGFVNRAEPGVVRQEGGTLLLDADGTTAVLDPATGAVRWSSATPVEPLPGTGLGVVQEQQFPPGSEYDPSSGNPGPIYVSASGVAHTSPPRRTLLHGVDMVTGRRLWSRPEAGSVDPGGTTTVPGALLVLAPDALTLLSGATGEVLRRHPLDPAPGADGLRADSYGDVLLVHSGPYGEGGAVTAYDSATLAVLWRHREDPGPGNSAGCFGLLCEKHGADMLVIDPRTGVTRWPARGSFDLNALGGATALEMLNSANRPMRTVDALTGRTLADLHGWRFLVHGDDGVPLVLSNIGGTRGMIFGAVATGGTRVQPLGYTGIPVTECRADARHVACIVREGLRVWSYRA